MGKWLKRVSQQLFVWIRDCSPETSFHKWIYKYTKNILKQSKDMYLNFQQYFMVPSVRSNTSMDTFRFALYSYFYPRYHFRLWPAATYHHEQCIICGGAHPPSCEANTGINQTKYVAARKYSSSQMLQLPGKSQFSVEVTSHFLPLSEDPPHKFWKWLATKNWVCGDRQGPADRVQKLHPSMNRFCNRGPRENRLWVFKGPCHS